MQSWRSNFNR